MSAFLYAKVCPPNRIDNNAEGMKELEKVNVMKHVVEDVRKTIYRELKRSAMNRDEYYRSH